jgi:hypothetical protein
VHTGLVPAAQVAAQVAPPKPPPQQDSPVPHCAVVVQSLFEPAGHVAPVWHVLAVKPPPPASAASAQHELPVAQSPLFAQIWVTPAGHDAAQAATPPSVPLQHTWPIMQLAVPKHGTGARHVITPSAPPSTWAQVWPLGQSESEAQTCGAPAAQVAAQAVMFTVPPSPPPKPPPPKQQTSPAPQLAGLVHETAAAPLGQAAVEAAHVYVGAAPTPPETQQTWDDGQLQPVVDPSTPPPPGDDVLVVDAPPDVPFDDEWLAVGEDVPPDPLFVALPPQATATANPTATATTARVFFRLMARSLRLGEIECASA